MEPAKQANAAPVSRTLWILLLVLCSLWIGFAAGTAIGARFFVPPGSGLAAGPIAMGYGAFGALVMAAFAGIAAWKSPAQSLRNSALIAALLSLVVLGFLVYRVIVVTNRPAP